MPHGTMDIRYVGPYRLRSWPIGERLFIYYIIKCIIIRSGPDWDDDANDIAVKEYDVGTVIRTHSYGVVLVRTTSLRALDTPGRLSAIFHKEDNLL